MDSNHWCEDEDEYLEYLRCERLLYAWCLERHGDYDPAVASDAALERYPFEPASNPNRGAIFHNEAWHWAMLAIHGGYYWHTHRELGVPSAEYRAEANRLSGDKETVAPR